jgi:hypothetical protein
VNTLGPLSLLCGLVCIWPLCFHFALTYILNNWRIERKKPKAGEVRVGAKVNYGSTPTTPKGGV